MAATIFDTPVVTPIFRAISHVLLKLVGWRAEGGLPNVRKWVLIAAPHTSNWDAPLMLALALHYRIRLRWFVKDRFFRPPWGALCRWLGAIAVDRSKTTNLVAQAIERLRTHDDYVIAVPPEGTRSSAKHWKSGFYHIAHGAGVPISLGYLDYRNRVGSIGPLFYPSGDIHADIIKIREHYAPIQPRFPDKKGPIELKEE